MEPLCTIKDKGKKIEECMLAVLFLSALCLAGADFANYDSFILSKLVSFILFLMIYSLWSKRPIIPAVYWRRIREAFTQANSGYSTESQQTHKLTVDNETSETTVNAHFLSTPMVIPRRKRRRICRRNHNTALEQLSLW